MMTQLKQSILFILLFNILFSLSVNVLAGDPFRQTYVVALQHQVPEILIPTLKPLLNENDSVSGFNNQLIVTTSPERIDTLRQLISTLDQPLRNLLIAVKNNNVGSSQDDNSGLSGGIRQGKVSVSTGEPIPGNQDGLTIRSNELAYSTSTTRRTFSTQAGQQIRAVEGSPAFIYTGESRQMPERDRYGNISSTDVNANQGFYVTARITGDRVLLDISISDDKFDSPSANTHQTTVSTRHLSTTVNGRLGEWISLGGITLLDHSDQQSVAKKITGSATSLGDISVKVVPVE